MAYRPNVRPSLFDYFQSSLSIQADHGVPHVSDLPFDLIEQNSKPYMERYFLMGANNQAPGTTARYHHILTSDLTALHDHPWDFISIILDGTYIETTPDGESEHGPGSVLARRAEDLHRLALPSGPVWTFIILSEPRKRWGFQTDDGWVHWSEYLRTVDQPAKSARSSQAGDPASRSW